MKKRPAGLGHVERRPTGTYVRVRLPTSGERPRVLLGPPDMSDAAAAARIAVIVADPLGFERTYLAGRAGQSTEPGKPVTFRDLGKLWTSGDLHRQHPDRVKAKRSAKEDAYLLGRHVYDHIGDKPLGAITLADCEAVLSSLPRDLAPATRRNVAQVMHRVLALAVFPVGVIKASPLPRGFLPMKGSRPALQMLYPDEERSLLACEDVPLAWRVACGVLAREGFRGPSELGAMTWTDVDLDRGAIRLDENKTDEPRLWAMAPDTRRALLVWRRILESRSPDLVAPTARVIVGVRKTMGIDLEHGAAHFRRFLVAAGVTRPELYERTAARRPIRLHDLRATFITVSLAAGKPETWIADRTGHRSSKQIQDYRRPARRFEELHLGGLCDMATTIPELARLAHAVAHVGGSGGPDVRKTPVHEGGLEPPSLAAPEPKPGSRVGSARKRLELLEASAPELARKVALGGPVAHALAHEMAAIDAAVGGAVGLWDALEEDVEMLAREEDR